MSLDIETLKKEAVPGETVLVCNENGYHYPYCGIVGTQIILYIDGKLHRDKPGAYKIKKETLKKPVVSPRKN